jgi:hypothetical protein
MASKFSNVLYFIHLPLEIYRETRNQIGNKKYLSLTSASNPKIPS